MEKQQLIIELEKLINKAESFIRGKKYHSFIDGEKSSDIQYYFGEVLTFIDKITGINKYFYNEAKNCINASRRQGGIHVMNISNLIGHLKYLKDAIENEWLIKFEEQIRGNDLIGFLDYAKGYLADGKKMESSVISSAIFEYALRQIGSKNSIEHRDIEQIINGLKRSNIITKVKSNQYKYFSSLRNNALHAKWTEFELNDIKSLIDELTGLINDNFTQE
ncbi:MAG: hypothetical protein HYY40_00920 [Bacteroidetes bacterium]|nr:hypothetical protein [Bacteroidota bacterium]